MTILGNPGDTIKHSYVTVAKDSPRFQETILIFMLKEEAVELQNHLTNLINDSNSFTAFALHTGTPKKGNPVIGDDV